MSRIPKKIHYCWFGGKPLPKDALKCIESWRRFLPDYEIIEWNESNFDVNSIPYTAQAYQAGKYAFVSDYARFKVLYEHGGLYFDTDVEVIRSFDDIVAEGPFMGIEVNNKVNPGLGLGAVPGMEIYKNILDYYRHLNFILPGGKMNFSDAVVNITTREMNKAGMKPALGVHHVAGITVYPPEWFNPFDDATGRLHLTDNSHSIHWFSKSWLKVNPLRQRLARLYHRLLKLTGK